MLVLLVLVLDVVSESRWYCWWMLCPKLRYTGAGCCARSRDVVLLLVDVVLVLLVLDVVSGAGCCFRS